jgi:hypothetical protein
MCSEVHLPGTSSIIMNSYIKSPLDLLGGDPTFSWGDSTFDILALGGQSR